MCSSRPEKPWSRRSTRKARRSTSARPTRRDSSAWQFREPIATLMIDGKTVGRHFAGPSWELTDGSLVTGKVSGSAPGATVADIPHLRLEVASQRGTGQLSRVTTIHRLNTKGGLVQGSCEQGRRLPQRALLGGLPVLQADR